jgi:hypothetical protein
MCRRWRERGLMTAISDEGCNLFPLRFQAQLSILGDLESMKGGRKRLERFKTDEKTDKTESDQSLFSSWVGEAGLGGDRLERLNRARRDGDQGIFRVEGATTNERGPRSDYRDEDSQYI